MSRTALKLSASVVGLLVAGLLTPGAASAAATGEDGDCAGMIAPATPATPPARPTASDATASVLAGGTVVIHAVPGASSSLAVVYTSVPSSGATCIDSSGAIEYFADLSPVDHVDTFTYAITDGYSFAEAKVSVSVKGVIGVNATVVKKAKNGRKAQLSFANANDDAVRILAGAPKKRHPDVRRTVGAHASTVIRSSRPKVFYVVTITDPAGTEIPVSFGTVNTSTGKVRAGNFADQRQRAALAGAWAAGGAL